MEGHSGAGEVAQLKRDLANVHRALMLQSDALARQRQRAGELELRLASQNSTAGRRLQARDQQLKSLVHALLILEVKLRKEQRQISLQLQTKNAQIYQQREQIKRLKQDAALKAAGFCRSCQHFIGSTSEQTNIETDPEFHSLDSVESNNQRNFERSMSYQEKQQPQSFQKNSRLSKSFHLPKAENADNTSSSEEVFENGDPQQKGGYVKNKQAFVRKDVTRRSRKYSGRKHTSAYLDSVQKRLGDHNQASSSSADDGEKVIKAMSKEECGNDGIGDAITMDIERASNRIDELLNASQNSESCLFNDSIQVRRKQNGVLRNASLSSRIESLHGIRHPPTSQRCSLRSEINFGEDQGKVLYDDKHWYSNVSDLGSETGRSRNKKQGRNSNSRYKSADDVLAAACNDVIINKIPSEYLPSPRLSRGTNGDHRDKYSRNNHCASKGESGIDCATKALNSNFSLSSNNKFENEPSENWYASASDQDDDPMCGIYKNNPVLECVNQILLQNNLEESITEKPKVMESNSPKNTKKVQFSTLNSISFEEHIKKNEENGGVQSFKTAKETKPAERRSNNKIVKFSLDTASEHSYEIPITSEGFSYEEQSIYSNDYEPIITKPCNGPTMNQKSNFRPIPMPRMINNVTSNSDHSKKSSVKNIAMNLENKMNGNHYVDMEIKIGQENVTKNKSKGPKVPPALPPKPKNLVSKFKFNNQLSKQQQNANALPNPTSNSDSVEPNQRIGDVPISKAKPESLCGSTKSTNGTEPDYCSISEVGAPVVSTGKNGLILSQTTVEIHAEQLSPNVAERRPIIVPKMATISKINPNKISDKDIPKLPQVTEIIIPDDDDLKDNARTSHDKYSSHTKLDSRNSIQIGHSISSILIDIKNRNSSIDDVNKCILASEHGRPYSGASYHKLNPVQPCPPKTSDKTKPDPNTFDNLETDNEKFDLSQNFEEFKIDDCEFTNIAMAEEYKISSSDAASTDSAPDETNPKPNIEAATPGETDLKKSDVYKISYVTDMSTTAPKDVLESTNGLSKIPSKTSSKMTNKPDLLSNIDNVETDSLRYSDLESSNSSSSNCGSYNTVKCEPSTFVKEVNGNAKVQQPTMPFEYFLEASGLSHKPLIARPPNSNHKNVLKPKDVKMRSKNVNSLGRATPLYEKCSNTAIKYFEPYL